MNIRKFNRYPLSNSFMFLGLIIAFCSVICGSTIFQNIENGRKDSKNYKYESEAVVTCFDNGSKVFDIKDLAEYDDINTEIIDIPMIIGEYTRVTTIAYAYNMEPPYKLLEGRFPGNEEIQNNSKVVDVGKDLMEDIYNREGKKYILIDGIEYQVIGILGSETSDVLDSLIYFVYDCLDDFHKEIVNSCDYFMIRFGSNYSDVSVKITDLFSNKSEEVSLQIEETSAFSVAVVNEHERDTYFFLVYAFAIGICVIISELWIFQRKDEIAILKTVGIKMIHIILRLYKSIIGIVISATVGAYLIIGLVEVITGDMMISLSGMLLVLGAMLVTSVIIFIIPLIKIELIEPAKGINARGNY